MRKPAIQLRPPAVQRPPDASALGRMQQAHGVTTGQICLNCRKLEFFGDDQGQRWTCRLSPERPRPTWSGTWTACGKFDPLLMEVRDGHA